MCGIAGAVGRSGSPEQRRLELELMCDQIVHRGPDDAGYFLPEEQHGVQMGMRRLSIIDLGGGHQPIHSEDGRVTTVFNGEIYNYREIRARLEQRGHRFATQSDTEVLVHLYEDVGPDLVHELNGMFGLAIWDHDAQRLFVARDRLGIKPLYYWPLAGGVAFASELKSLTVLPDFPAELDLEAIAYYLALGYVPEPLTVFKGVKKLCPGERLTWSAQSGLQVDCYWSPIVPVDEAMSEAHAVERVKELVTDAVRLRLVSDVPLGAFLSGGVDSSTVVAEMTRLMDRPVQTFSIGFEEREFNEADDARAVADHLQADHTQLVVRPEVDELVERVVAAFDEPFSDPSSIPTYLVCRLARERVTVSLSGDGGDELFGGYTRYQSALARNVSLPSPLAGLMRAVMMRAPHSTLGRRRLLEYTRSARGRYAGMVGHPLDPRLGGIAGPGVLAHLPDFDRSMDRWFDAAGGRDYASQVMAVDTLSYLPGDILTKVDRMSMAVSLEARVPLLDHRLVEFAGSIPSHIKLKGDGKWPLRQVAIDALPERVYSKRKQGFGVPLRLWFRNELRHRVESLRDPGARIYGLVSKPDAARLFDEHLRGRRDHATQIWRLLVLEFFLERVMAPAAAPRHSLTPVA